MVIKTCSCFIDRAVWFINLSDTAPRFWYFDSTINYSKNKRDAFLIMILLRKFVQQKRF